MQARHIIAAGALAALSAAAQAAPLSSNLGVDPNGAILSGSVLSGASTKSFSFALSQMSDVSGALGYLPEFQFVGFSAIELVSGSNSWFASSPGTGQFSFNGLQAGNYSLKITAASDGLGVYAGSLTAVPAVPEASSMALALAGLGVVGFIAAKRRKA